MSNESSSGQNPSKPKSFLDRLFGVFHEPTREDFIDTLHEANEQKLIDDSALKMMEGVMQFSKLRACDLMVPRAQMVVVDLSEPREVWLPYLIETEHSRYPVILDGDKDNVVGILHAKTLLHFLIDSEFLAKDHLRAPKFIPESMPLNVLLRDFRTERNHMAIVVDEFGGVSGLITIEDVLEQIVGEIDDEFDDIDEDADNILEDRKHGGWRVRALTEIEQFENHFDVKLDPENQCLCDTVGGLVIDHFEHMPKVGESVTIGEFKFTVLRANDRKVSLLRVERLSEGDEVLSE